MSEKRTGETIRKLYWELPLGVIRGYQEEPGPRFIDPYAEEERRAIQEYEREVEERIKRGKA